MSSLLERARELKRRVRETGHAKGGLSARLYLDLIEFFEMVEEKEEAANIEMQPPANIPQLTIPLYPDAKSEARERRNLAIAQIAAFYWRQPGLSIEDAIKAAKYVFAEVEKQEAGK